MFDVIELADAAGFGLFHVVGHDLGAALAWTLASTPQGRTRMKSISALSVPHVDAFSDALYGPHADCEQQYASQYLAVFTLPNSASLRWNFLYNRMANARATEYSSGYTVSEFQKTLFWYNGMHEAGILASPPQQKRN